MGRIKQVGGDALYAKFIEREFGVECVPEYRFHPVRRWRFDFAIPSLKIAIELDGAVWSYGRHNRPAGYIKDMEKLNTAASLGWLVLRFQTGKQYEDDAFGFLKKTIKFRQNGTR